LRLRKAELQGGEPWLQVVDTAGAVIGAVDMSDVAAITCEAERRTNVLLDGKQEVVRQIAAVEAKMAAPRQDKGVRRAKSADAVQTNRFDNAVCFTCHET